MGLGFDAMQSLADELVDRGIRATADPRNANVPCVLVTPPARTYDLAEGWSATWQLVALAPGPANADAALVLDELVDAVAELLPLTTVTYRGYPIDELGDLPAAVMTFEGIVC